MKLLIEFYHKNILENMVAAIGIQPDIVMFYFDPMFFTHTAVYNTYLACRRYIPHLKLELGTCSSSDFWAMEDKLLRYIEDNSREEILIDLTGGNELAAVASYRCAQNRNIDLICADIRNFRIYSINAPEHRFGCQSMEIADIVEAAGGKVISCADAAYLDKNRENLYATAGKVLENVSAWAGICSFFQKNSISSRANRTRHFSAPVEKRGKGRRPVPDEKLLHFLARTHMIQNLSIKNDRIQFDYRDMESLNFLTTYGVWLEFLTYYALKASKKFHDVKNSLKVDWNRNDDQDIIGNEIDVTAMFGCVPVVVSCKMSENATDADAVNELYAVSHRVSRGHVIRVLVTYSNIKERRMGIYLKAREMGIIVMDENDIRHADFSKRLERAICQARTIIR